MKSTNFADRLLKAINDKGNPCVVGFDPRLDQIPNFIIDSVKCLNADNQIINAILGFHTLILDIIKDFVPAIKTQIAFFEQYGLPGLIAFKKTISAAKERGLIVIVDAKRNDIGSTAEAYANAFLGKTNVFGNYQSIFDVDALTVNPYLGSETLTPFIHACEKYGKGIFVLVKTSNPGSGDIQDKINAKTNSKVYAEIAEITNQLGKKVIGKAGYSSIGAVVGATYPGFAEELRQIMHNNIFLVPGYGIQGASGKDILNCFNKDKQGAIISASRSITFSGYNFESDKHQFTDAIYNNTKKMIEDVTNSLNIK